MLTINDENMKKYLTVKQTHRYTNEKNLMFQGHANYEQKAYGLCISYKEDEQTSVTVMIQDDEISIKREGEFITSLMFRNLEKTQGSVLSEFGTIDLEIYTHKYIRKENIVALEYDILSGGNVTDGYRILWITKEDQA